MKRLPLFIAAGLTATTLGVQSAPPSRVLGTLAGFDEDGAYIAPAIGTSRIYLVNDAEDALSMFDRATRKTMPVATGEMWDPAVSPKADWVAFVRTGENAKSGRDEFIWALPLDPKTGLAAGPARRVSMSTGHEPRFSPDGSMIAFAGDEPSDNITVVPAGGGEERVVVKVGGGISRVQWSPDAKFIYFGLGPNRNTFRPDRLLLRARVENGKIDTVVRSSGPGSQNGSWAGLSPDGKTLLTGTGQTGMRQLLSDADGKRLGEFTVSPDTWVWPWTSPTTFLTTKDVTRTWLVAVSLADGRQRLLTDTVGEAVAPVWSPDGKHIAFAHPSTQSLVVMNADGSGKQTLALRTPIHTETEAARALQWSPDGRSILYTGATGGTASANHVIDLASGRERDVFKGGDDARAAMWMSDSKTILYTRIIDADSSVIRSGIGSNGECVWGPCIGGQPGFHGVRLVRHEVHLVSADGQDRVVRDIRADCPACIWRISDTTILFGRVAESAVASLKSAAPARKLVPGDTLTNRRYEPAVSPDGQWLAFGRFPGTRMSGVDFVMMDGSSHHSVALPDPLVPGPGNPTFAPDSRSVLVMCRVRGKPERALYRITVASGEVARVLTIVRPRDSMRDYMISPDGRSLLYSAIGQATTQLNEVDVSGLLSAQQQGAHKR